VKINLELCTGCGTCEKNCPLNAVVLEDKKPIFTAKCVSCSLCMNLCPNQAISLPDLISDDEIVCEHCPVGCRIKDGFTGACQRYIRKGDELVPTRSLVIPPPPSMQEIRQEIIISHPVITGIGAGTTYPDYIPAPYAVMEKRDDVDVVTVVTEAPLTYSSMVIKIDTERFIGNETAPVKHKGKVVGHVTTEQYGSKMISIGGINLMKGKNKVELTRLMVNIANLEEFELMVEGGASLLLEIGKPPIIDGVKSDNMKVACGAAIMGMAGPMLKGIADEVIILDADITGLFSESHVGKLMGFSPTSIKPPGTYATPGRYFGEHGDGWGGTKVMDPVDAIADFDPDKLFPGMRVLVLEVTGTKVAMLKLNEKKEFVKVDVPPEAERVRKWIYENREASLVSAIYMGGAGGSARAGITQNPIALTKALHNGEVVLSVGGVKAFVLPGGGINFMVDISKIKWRSFTWVPSPAMVVPIEYTMTKDVYYKLGGHKRKLTLLEELKR